MSESLLQKVVNKIGGNNVLNNPEDMTPYVKDWRGRMMGKALAVVRPANTEDVAFIVKEAAKSATPLVPQGGNTGLVLGGIPDESGTALVVSLQRMNKVRVIDAANNSITVDAGLTLLAVQEAANKENRLFPLSLAAEGTATIGGNISTNAGGIRVLKFGMMRQLVLGLEVVLANGDIWSDLSGNIKDNTGYDLKQLFIGAEGTLGIVTGAVLRLFPKPKSSVTAMLGFKNIQQTMNALQHLKERFGGELAAFEMVPEIAISLAVKNIPGTQYPFKKPLPYAVLIDLWSAEDEETATFRLEAGLADMMEKGTLEDAVIAKTQAQCSSLWRLREGMAEAMREEGQSIKHDVSVPLSVLPAFVKKADAAVLKIQPDARIIGFGHAADGNLHYDIFPASAEKTTALLARRDAIHKAVHDVAMALGGSIAAEHGIGRQKRDEIAQRRTKADLLLRQSIKKALDPQNIMNPGVLLS